MQKFFLSLLFSLLVSVGFGQKIYFVYLQSDNAQPFFVRMDEKVFSSSASGYLILSRLKDSTYTFNLGFPQQSASDLKFSVTMNKKDHGYLLKNFADKGWGLFDLQTFAVQMPVNSTANQPQKPLDNNNVTPFTEILSKAADDPSLKEKPAKVEEKKPEPVVVKTEPVAVKEPVKTDPVVTAVVKTEEPVTTNKEPVKETKDVVEKTEITTPPVAKQEKLIDDNGKTTEPQPVVYKPSQVIKTAEKPGTDSHDIEFVDKNTNGNTDTIRIQIPEVKTVVPPVTEPVKEEKDEKKFIEVAEKKDPVKTETVQKEEIPAEKKQEPAKTETKNVVTVQPAYVCKETAFESDFLKLRKKMAGADDDEAMITEAKKYFKVKCFTVYQVRNLSTLFLTDEGKYKFFDAAYTYVADKQNFNSLELELKDAYYVTRFRAMLR